MLAWGGTLPTPGQLEKWIRGCTKRRVLQSLSGDAKNVSLLVDAQSEGNVKWRCKSRIYLTIIVGMPEKTCYWRAILSVPFAMILKMMHDTGMSLLKSYRLPM